MKKLLIISILILVGCKGKFRGHKPTLTSDMVQIIVKFDQTELNVD